MRIKYLLAGASALGLAMALATGAAAQSTSGNAAGTPATNEVSDVVVTGRFIDTGAASATKQNLSTLDTPFSVSAYTNDFMKAIAYFLLRMRPYSYWAFPSISPADPPNSPLEKAPTHKANISRQANKVGSKRGAAGLVLVGADSVPMGCRTLVPSQTDVAYDRG